MNSDYSFLSRCLHRLTLGSDSVAANLHRMECRRIQVSAREQEKKHHVFVSGLARAGTTILMRSLYESGEFGSLTYQDMPFVLSPNFWAGLQGDRGQDTTLHERAHGDRLLVGKQSPEALDEVFWRVYTGGEYIQSDRLTPYRTPDALDPAYRRYVALILKRYGRPRYLCKNNNNLLRLGSIARTFPNATILIPFRNPRDHACSLLTQHQRFRDLHKKNRFSRAYMGWLVHHEFGGDHRPMVFDDARPEGDPLQMEYWLDVWKRTYTHVLRNRPRQSLLVGYEALCDSTKGLWPQIAQRLQLPDAPPPAFDPPPSSGMEDLPAEVSELYEALTAASRQDFSL